MAPVTVKGIGPAERRIVQMLIEDITTGDRNNARMAKKIRCQFKLREFKFIHDELVEEEKKRLIASLGEKPDPKLVGQINIKVTGVSWFTMLEAGYHENDQGDEMYGRDFIIDKTTLEWLRDRRNERKVWIEGSAREEKNDEGKPKKGELRPLALAPPMLDAIATLDEAMDEALRAG